VKEVNKKYVRSKVVGLKKMYLYNGDKSLILREVRKVIWRPSWIFLMEPYTTLLFTYFLLVIYFQDILAFFRTFRGPYIFICVFTH